MLQSEVPLPRSECHPRRPEVFEFVKTGNKPQVSQRQGLGVMSRIFAGLLGAFLGLSLLKFGNPVIMEKWVTPPTDVYEFLLGYPWPIGWAYGLLILVALAGLFCIRRVPEGVPRWLILVPLAWLVWEFLSGTQSVEPRLSHATM